MLIQMPRGSADSPGTQNAEDCTTFEAALRRDLATAPVVSYESMIGGWSKRAFDLTLTILSAPIWAPAMLGAAAWSKLQHPARVFVSDERIGYGGRAFKCYALRMAPPSAVVERLHGEDAPANDMSEIVRRAEDGREKWRRAFERLPQFLNVLRGEMSLVGPRPLPREALEPMRTAKRYYLSARPGIVGVSSVADPNDGPIGQYKAYALAWLLSADVLIMWDALRSLRDRGELWRPARPRRKLANKSEEPQVPVRRRSAAS